MREKTEVSRKGYMNARAEMFVNEYLKDLNATQAAIRAGYSPKTARSIGAENLTKPDIAAAIEKAMGERAMRCELTADMVVQELKKIAFSNMSDLARWNASGVEVKDSSELSSFVVAAVHEVIGFTTSSRRSNFWVSTWVCGPIAMKLRQTKTVR